MNFNHPIYIANITGILREKWSKKDLSNKAIIFLDIHPNVCVLGGGGRVGVDVEVKWQRKTLILMLDWFTITFSNSTLVEVIVIPLVNTSQQDIWVLIMTLLLTSYLDS